MPILKSGDLIRHEKFGLGVVTEDEHEGMVSADFDGQVKRLSLQYAPLFRISNEDERKRRFRFYAGGSRASSVSTKRRKCGSLIFSSSGWTFPRRSNE